MRTQTQDEMTAIGIFLAFVFFACMIVPALLLVHTQNVTTQVVNINDKEIKVEECMPSRVFSADRISRAFITCPKKLPAAQPFFKEVQLESGKTKVKWVVNGKSFISAKGP